LVGTEDSVAGTERGSWWGRKNDACEFGAEEEGEGGLVLVFSCHLEEVEEVCGGGVDFYED
jgi:hypothetical protein